jgi:hypothetical protein
VHEQVGLPVGVAGQRRAEAAEHDVASVGRDGRHPAVRGDLEIAGRHGDAPCHLRGCVIIQAEAAEHRGEADRHDESMSIHG